MFQTNPDQKNYIPEKNLSKVVKSQNSVGKCYIKCVENIALQNKVCKFSHYCVTCGNCYHFRLKNGSNSARSTIMRKFAKFVRLYFPYFTRFRGQILKFYYFILKGSFREIRFLCLNLPRPEISLQGELSIVMQ